MTDPIKRLADAVMRGVVNSGAIFESDVDVAVKIMRAELKEFVCGPKYADSRECLKAGTLSEAYVLAGLVADCVLQITAAKA